MRSRRGCSLAEVQNPFRGITFQHKETNRVLNEGLIRHGCHPLNMRSRTMRLWQKCRAGQLPPDTAAKVERDHAKEFAEFDRLNQQPKE